jgi:hypothetical protein
MKRDWDLLKNHDYMDLLLLVMVCDKWRNKFWDKKVCYGDVSSDDEAPSHIVHIVHCPYNVVSCGLRKFHYGIGDLVITSTPREIHELFNILYAYR